MYRTGKYLNFLVLSVALVMPLGLAEIASPDPKRKAKEESNNCDSVKIQCLCGIGSTRKTVEVNLKMYAVHDSKTNASKCSGFPDPYQKCASRNCVLSPNSTVSYGKNGTSGEKLVSFLQSFYPKEFSISRGGEEDRHARQADPCHVTPLKNAEIKCWKWPNWINCDVTCIHGYALQTTKESIRKTNVNCRLTENVWKPHGFIDCQPFLNCRAHLTKPGDLRCKEPVDGPAYCEISCMDYDEFEATPRQKYECLDDTFARTLPHCAELSDSVQLIRKPAA